jgi:hypothetical protein
MYFRNVTWFVCWEVGVHGKGSLYWSIGHDFCHNFLYTIDRVHSFCCRINNLNNEYMTINTLKANNNSFLCSDKICKSMQFYLDMTILHFYRKFQHMYWQNNKQCRPWSFGNVPADPSLHLLHVSRIYCHRPRYLKNNALFVFIKILDRFDCPI